jgi:heme-degrading monooxygenase HmoA
VFDFSERHPESSTGMHLEALMKPIPSRIRSIFSKTALATATLAGFLLFGVAPRAKADAWDDCNRRVTYTEWRYNEAVEHFGPYSRQARHWAHERHEAYERREHLRHEWRERHFDRDRR